jgi:aryl-alcohol dehydrogenase-like predicted oxidoreductase
MDSTQHHSPELRKLGRTSLSVTALGLGTWQFSEGKGGAAGSWGAISAGETDGIIAAALEGGINWLDTAELYGWGRSERAVSRGLQAAGKGPGDVVVATKWNPLFRRATSIPSTIGARLDALAPFPVDLHQVHFPASFSRVESMMNKMADLLDAGQIRAVGVSNFGASQMRRAAEALDKRGHVLASNQVQYSLVHRAIENNGVLDAAKELGVTIIAYSPLAMGLVTGKFHEAPSRLKGLPWMRRTRLRQRLAATQPVVDALGRVAEAHNASPTQVALAWVTSRHGETVVAIPGASKVHHATEAAGALRLRLTDAEIGAIDDASRGGPRK